MTEPRSEDQLIEEALRALDEGLPGPAAGPADEAAETMVRLYTEVLGLVAYGAPAATPRPALRERVLALVRGDETLEVVPSVPAGAALRWTPAPSAPPVPGTAVPPEKPPLRYTPPPLRPARRPSRWPLALAAGLALALLGTSVWFYLGLVRQSEQLDALRAELQGKEQRLSELEQSDSALADLQARLALVTSTAVEVCPLRPVGEPPPQPGARGVLFVAADHQHWFLFVQGLQPVGPGRDYQLWFIADGTPISAGVFEAEDGTPVNLSSAEMPAGTQTAAITVEPEGGAPAPTGPMVLKAAEPFKVL
jgi:hypothetical protein